MNAYTIDGDFSICGIKVFIFNFTEFSSVNCIGILRPKPLYIKAVCATSGLFVGRNADFNRTVRECFFPLSGVPAQ